MSWSWTMLDLPFIEAFIISRPTGHAVSMWPYVALNVECKMNEAPDRWSAPAVRRWDAETVRRWDGETVQRVWILKSIEKGPNLQWRTHSHDSQVMVARKSSGILILTLQEIRMQMQALGFEATWEAKEGIVRMDTDFICQILQLQADNTTIYQLISDMEPRKKSAVLLLWSCYFNLCRTQMALRIWNLRRSSMTLCPSICSKILDFCSTRCWNTDCWPGKKMKALYNYIFNCIILYRCAPFPPSILVARHRSLWRSLRTNRVNISLNLQGNAEARTTCAFPWIRLSLFNKLFQDMEVHSVRYATRPDPVDSILTWFILIQISVFSAAYLHFPLLFWLVDGWSIHDRFIVAHIGWFKGLRKQL